ncbi:hypothetical protein [Mycolicibacterium sp.]|uniref:hypothetical protein n=1 Tax=Mycolicibacterium sp. TaxID=2320850 RepID=UPI003D0BF44F
MAIDVRAKIEPPDRPTTSGTFGRLLILWYLIAIFTVFSLQVGDVRITCFYAFPAAVVMLARNLSGASRGEIILLAGLIAVALVSVVAGLDPDFTGERFKSFLLFCYSLFMAYALRLELGRSARKDVAWISGWLLAVIMAAAALEVLGPLKPISDSFRAWNSPLIYMAERRDLAIAGFIRPSVFTQEPSYVAIGVAVLSFVWFVSTRSRYRIIIFGIVTALALYLFRSPISAITLPAAGYLLLASAFRRATGQQRVRNVYFTVIAIAFTLPLAYLALSAIFAARRVSGGSLGDQSLVIRLAAPPRIAALVFEDSPFFGAGLGGRPAIITQIQTVFGELGVLSAFQQLSRTEEAIPNAFWEHWIYLGLVGGVLAGYAIYRYFRGLCSGGNWIAAVVFLLLLANSFGAYTTPRFWSYATLVLLAVALSAEAGAAKSPDPPMTPALGGRPAGVMQRGIGQRVAGPPLRPAGSRDDFPR